MTIYQELLAADVPLDNHESDLYALVTDASRAIVARYQHREIVKTFTSEVDGKLWYDIPFAYTPFWERRQSGAGADS